MINLDFEALVNFNAKLLDCVVQASKKFWVVFEDRLHAVVVIVFWNVVLLQNILDLSQEFIVNLFQLHVWFHFYFYRRFFPKTFHFYCEVSFLLNRDNLKVSMAGHFHFFRHEFSIHHNAEMTFDFFVKFFSEKFFQIGLGNLRFSSKRSVHDFSIHQPNFKSCIINS